MGVENEIGRLAPAGGAAAVDISSTDAPITPPSRGIYVGGAGDLKVDLPNGTTVTFVALAAGLCHPIAATKVYKTGTTATSILALK